MFSQMLTSCLLAGSLVGLVAGQPAPLADPTRPDVRGPGGAAGANAAQPLRLEGIVIGASRRLALIDGEFLEEGERIYGVDIERIDRETVTVRRAGKVFVLRPEAAAAEDVAEPGEPE